MITSVLQVHTNPVGADGYQPLTGYVTQAEAPAAGDPTVFIALAARTPAALAQPLGKEQFTT